jgi:hypothetical protein
MNTADKLELARHRRYRDCWQHSMLAEGQRRALVMRDHSPRATVHLLPLQPRKQPGRDWRFLAWVTAVGFAALAALSVWM